MTRIELYHNKSKHLTKAGRFFILIGFITVSLFAFRYYYLNSIHIKGPNTDLGRKVVVQLPSGQKVYTYENLIAKQGKKTIYKGEFNTIDLTGGTITLQDWK